MKSPLFDAFVRSRRCPLYRISTVQNSTVQSKGPYRLNNRGRHPDWCFFQSGALLPTVSRVFSAVGFPTGLGVPYCFFASKLRNFTNKRMSKFLLLDRDSLEKKQFWKKLQLCGRFFEENLKIFINILKLALSKYKRWSNFDDDYLKEQLQCASSDFPKDSRQKL